MTAEAWNKVRQLADSLRALADAELAELASAPAAPEPVRPLAWGAKVSATFRQRIRLTGRDFGFDPNWLMACMAFETGRTFSPSIRNPKSTATGLIQFMAATAAEYGVTTDQLAAMTAESQIDYVWKYFRDRIRQHGPIRRLTDCYMAILNPAAMGKPDDWPMWVAGSSQYAANAGLDANKDHTITKAEAGARVAAVLAEGLHPENVA
jgi:hypothetical protein